MPNIAHDEFVDKFFSMSYQEIMLAIYLLTILLATQEDLSLSFDEAIEQNEQCPCVVPNPYEEKELFSQVSKSSRQLYNSLDCIGKQRAIELSKVCEDKNCAIEQAAREMSRRQNGEYPFQEDYQRQRELRNGSKPYNRRFGY